MSLDHRVGLYAPCNNDEASQMACLLADVLRQSGHRVEYVTYQERAPTHPFWDPRVRSVDARGFRRWTKRLSQLIWFDLQPRRLRHAVPHCPNILVPLWHRLREQDLPLLSQFRHVVSPCHQLAVRLRGLAGPHGRVHSSSWLSGLWPSPVRVEPAEGLSLLVRVCSAAIADYGAVLLSVLQILLDRLAGLRLTLVSQARWGRHLQPAVDHLLQSFPGRATVLHKPTRAALVGAHRQQDWTFCASPLANSPLLVAESLLLGVPVIAFDIPPFNELVVDGHNGSLISSITAQHNWLGAPRAEPRASLLLDALTRILENQKLLSQVHDRQWSELRNGSQMFRLLWNKILVD